MAITTEAQLETAITSWLGGRTDLTSVYPDWITLFEAHVARELRVRPMESISSLTPSSGVATLPTDYLGWRRVTWTGTPRQELSYVTPKYFQESYPTQPSGVPVFFTIEASSLRVMPKSDTTLDFVYYTKNTAIASTLNWLFNTFPDVYLWGALTEAYAFLADDGQFATAKARRDEIMDEVAQLYRHEQGPMRVRVEGVTP